MAAAARQPLVDAGRRETRLIVRNMKFPVAVRALAFLLALLVALPVAAQVPPLTADTPAPAESPPDPFGRESPRGLARGLIDALGEQDYERATQYFDLESVAESRRAERGAALARQLQALLDAGGSLVPIASLSDRPSGDVDDRLPPGEERIGSLPSEEGEIPLIAELQEADDPATWRISWETLTAMPSVAQPPPTASLREALPGDLGDADLFGAPIVDWLILLIVGALLYLAVRLVLSGLLFLLGRTRRDARQSPLWRFADAASSPLSLYLAMLLFLATTRTLEVAIVARELLSRMAGAIALLAMAWFLWRLVDAGADLMALRMDKRQRRRGKAVIVFARRVAKLVLLAGAAIAFLDTFGLDVTAGVAALGLGGLALALGAQKTVENFVGGISVLADQPVRVGDFCRVGDVIGTVEDIGIRSTRIRTNERTRVTIPNGNFSSLQIENFALRDKYLFDPTLELTRDLDAAGLERVIEAIRAGLRSADFVEPGGRATFNGFGPGSFRIETFAYLVTPDFEESLEMRERLLLDLMRRVEAAGGRFALPVTQVRLAEAAGEEADRRTA